MVDFLCLDGDFDADLLGVFFDMIEALDLDLFTVLISSMICSRS